MNVERSFKVGDEGAILSRHDCHGLLMRSAHEGHDRVRSFALDPQWLRFVLHKGYVGVDGASITVSSVDRENGVFHLLDSRNH